MVGEFRKPVDHNVGRGVGCGIGRAGGSPLVGSAHKGGAIADAAGRIEVEIVARHHQDLVRLDGHKRGGAPIGIGVRLVNAQHLAWEYGVPIDAVAARCIDDQRWHQLDAWPDFAAALRRLRRQAEDRERDADAVPTCTATCWAKYSTRMGSAVRQRTGKRSPSRLSEGLLKKTPIGPSISSSADFF